MKVAKIAQLEGG